jgi:hypothetical protein
MTMVRLGEAATAGLEAAGWRPGRKVAVAAYVEALAELGFTAPGVLVDFYAQYGGLTVTFPDPRHPELTNAYILDPTTAPMISSTSWVGIWSEWVGEPLCPFGEAHRMLAVMAQDGRVWLGFDDLLLFVADSPVDSINALCDGRDTPRVAPPGDFARQFPPTRPGAAGSGHEAAEEAASAALREAEQLVRQAGAEAATDLDLSGLDLPQLPESLGSLTGLTELYLDDNKLTSLPENLGRFSRLTRLSASGNLLTTLPESIGKLAGLTYLNLNGNRLTALPDAIGGLRKLTFLGLVGNQLSALPESIGNLTALTKLYAPGNRLAELPDSISRLTRLEELWLSDNRLTRLPADIDSMPALTSLSIDRNPVSAR